MDRIINKDKMETRDGIAKGVVMLREANGKIIFKKNNMIVLEGRKAILKHLLKSGGNNFSLTSLYLGKGTSVTSPEYDFEATATTALKTYLLNNDTTENNGSASISYMSNVLPTDAESVFMNDIDYTYIPKTSENSDSSVVLTVDGEVAYYDDGGIKKPYILTEAQIKSGLTGKIKVDGKNLKFDPKLLYDSEGNNIPANTNTEPFIKVIARFSGSQGFANNVTELGLLFKDNDNNTEELFSRVIFEPVPFSTNTRYELIYYIYF